MSVNIFYEDTNILDLDPEFFVFWITDICKSEKHILGNINLIFCSDAYLLNINKVYLNHDYYTDIITFDYYEKNISGDLFISIDRVNDNATTIGVDFKDELHRVVAHGCLHLLGYGDESVQEKELMTKKENAALNLIVSRET